MKEFNTDVENIFEIKSAVNDYIDSLKDEPYVDSISHELLCIDYYRCIFCLSEVVEYNNRTFIGYDLCLVTLDSYDVISVRSFDDRDEAKAAFKALTV